MVSFDPRTARWSARRASPSTTCSTRSCRAGSCRRPRRAPPSPPIGGAVANDIHGKNHDREGSFGDHVLWLDLILPSGELVRVSPTERPELFAATIGGIGLTGVILNVCFRLRPVASGRPWWCASGACPTSTPSWPVWRRRARRPVTASAGSTAWRAAAGLGAASWKPPRRPTRRRRCTGRWRSEGAGGAGRFPGLRAQSLQHQPVQPGLLPPRPGGGPDAHPAGAAVLLSARRDPPLEPHLRQARLLPVPERDPRCRGRRRACAACWRRSPTPAPAPSWRC